MELYKFKNKQLAQIWRIHPSYKKSKIFQRLEFFGDKILSFVLTSYLLENLTLSEGELSIKLSSLINKDAVSMVGEILKQYITCTGSLTNAMLCDCTEVYIACIYLDGGDTFKIIKKMWKHLLNQEFEASYKNQLQEILQTKQLLPIYNYEEKIKCVCNLEICDCRKIFICTITLKEEKYQRFIAVGEGFSKKTASSNAAKIFINKYQKEF